MPSATISTTSKAADAGAKKGAGANRGYFKRPDMKTKALNDIDR